MCYFLMYSVGFFVMFSYSEWFMVWMGLEMVMFSFLLVVVDLVKSNTVMSCYRYFFVQGAASGGILGLLYYSGWDYIVEILLWFKLGAGPFYFWYISVLQDFSWGGCFFLMTFQKVPGFVLLWDLGSLYKWFIIIFSLVLGVWGIFNCLNLKELLGYSSVHYLGWVLLGQLIDKELWLYYFSMYVVMLFGVIMVVGRFFVVGFGYSMNVAVVVLCLLVLGGIPPFLGFIIKWLGFMFFFEIDIFIVLFLVVCSVFMCYSYLRIGFGLLMSGGSKGSMVHDSGVFFFVFVNMYLGVLGLMLVGLY
uniref:NADH-ubiquinone oxidoreductase chain 2 n=2 Tax=unclassified Mesabolivar TaxID=2625251 RepID=A0A411FER9_9ARAC|nr:NADH dehydrogenase subunit 2 [Mesabolivar sp. ITV1036I1]YP_009554247.1 NADH dehydrogenase subunit 2 [Mesabolivar sp. ITV1036I3]QBA91977.1 NADH dehydrogenase subunit 2 [Mesabolivar sp. ITV1036I1]QBA92003.1 NADH dehydrogenase subunit 2 [Mesabolivar sp. ITV1036I3]